MAKQPQIQPKLEDIPDPEADKYIQYLYGDEQSYLPSELRLFKDYSWTNKVSRLLVEGIKESDLFTEQMQQILSSAQYFNLINSSLNGKCWALLKYGHVENADTVAQLLKTLMPHVTVHQSNFTKDQEYREFGELQCQENLMIDTLAEPRVVKRCVFEGVLINGIPMNLATAQLEVFFPGAKQIFIARDCKRSDGHIEYMEHKYAFALYENEEQTEAALQAHPTHEIKVDGHRLTLINFHAIKDVVNGEANISYSKVLPDKTRHKVILLVRPMLKVLKMIHEQLTKFAAQSSGPSRKQRKDMTQRKKDIVRKIAAMHKALTLDTNRRRSKSIPILDTPQEKILWTTCLDEGRNILGREMFNNYMVRTAPPVPGVSIAPRINTAESLGIPTPQELAMKRSGTTPAADKAKRGRWDGGATRGRGAAPAGGGATRGRGAGANAYSGSRGGYAGASSYADGYGSSFVPASTESYSNGASRGSYGGGRGLLGSYDGAAGRGRGGARGRGRGAGDAARGYGQHEDYSMEYEEVSYPTSHMKSATRSPARAPAQPQVDMSIILDMKQQISALTSKLEKVGNAVAAPAAAPPPPPEPAALMKASGYGPTPTSYPAATYAAGAYASNDPYGAQQQVQGYAAADYGMYYSS